MTVAELGTILSIWAHPDDETYLAAGVMAAAVDRGQRVVCVSATAGEHGTADPDAWPPARLGRCAAGRRPRRWPCSASPSTTSSACPTAPSPTTTSDGLGLVGQLLDEVEPDTILTFGPDGMTFHPDHIAVHRWVTEAWHRRGRRARLALRHPHRRAPRPLPRPLRGVGHVHDRRAARRRPRRRARRPRPARRSATSTASSPRSGPWRPRPAA